MRELPHHNESEAAILGGIILRGRPALSDVLDVVTEDDFYSPAYQAVFKAIKALDSRDAPLDPTSIADQLESTSELKLAGGIISISGLSDRYASSSNITHHARRVREAATVRALALACREIADRAMDPVEDTGAFIDEAERQVMKINERGRATTYKSSTTLLPQIFEQIAARAKRQNPITGVPTCYIDLDKLTGGLQPGDLVIIAARPSMGKTAFVLNIAQNTCIPSSVWLLTPPEERRILQPVLFFSLEMGELQLVERILCAEAKVDYSKLRAGSFVQDDFHRLIAAAERMAKAQFYIDDQSSPSILEMRARARRWRADRSIFTGQADEFGMVVVDYLQLARGSQARYGSRELEISDISRGLKAMAKELKLPVVALSQLNRAVDSRADHRPVLSDLRESGAIEQDADVIMFIYREERYLAGDAKPEERAKVEGKAEIILAKARNGPIGTVNLTFIKQHTRFENAENTRH